MADPVIVFSDVDPRKAEAAEGVAEGMADAEKDDDDDDVVLTAGEGGREGVMSRR